MNAINYQLLAIPLGATLPPSTRNDARGNRQLGTPDEIDISTHYLDLTGPSTQRLDPNLTAALFAPHADTKPLLICKSPPIKDPSIQTLSIPSMPKVISKINLGFQGNLPGQCGFLAENIPDTTTLQTVLIELLHEANKDILEAYRFKKLPSNVVVTIQNGNQTITLRKPKDLEKTLAELDVDENSSIYFAWSVTAGAHNIDSIQFARHDTSNIIFHYSSSDDAIAVTINGIKYTHFSEIVVNRSSSEALFIYDYLEKNQEFYSLSAWNNFIKLEGFALKKFTVIFNFHILNQNETVQKYGGIEDLKNLVERNNLEFIDAVYDVILKFCNELDQAKEKN